jgi:transposase
MFRKISRDIKIAVLNLYESDISPLEDILACVGFSKRTFYRILKLWKETGDVVTHRHANKGRFCLLHHDDIQYLLLLIRHRPDWFLDELLDLLQTN